MTAKEEALKDILVLARSHGITAREIAEAFADPGTAKSGGGLVGKLFAYLGGIFVFAGIAVYVGMFWDEMNSAMRVIITLGSGVTSYALALLATKDVRFEKAIVPFFLVAAVLQPSGMLVAIDEYFNNGGDWRYASLLVAGVMLVQQGMTFRFHPNVVVLLATVGFGATFFATLFDLMGVDEDFIAIVIGASLMFLARAMDKTPQRVITPLWYFIGSVSFLYGSFDQLQGSVVELLYLALSCFMIFVSTVVRSRTLLAVATIALLSYVGYFTQRHFVNSLGWPISLMVFGFVLLGISGFALKLGKNITRGE